MTTTIQPTTRGDIFIYHGKVDAEHNELRCFKHLDDAIKEVVAASPRKLNFQKFGVGWLRLTAKSLAGQMSIYRQIYGADSPELAAMCLTCVSEIIEQREIDSDPSHGCLP
jgi:hypothetical protein